MINCWNRFESLEERREGRGEEGGEGERVGHNHKGRRHTGARSLEEEKRLKKTGKDREDGAGGRQ